jgi:hypothetical protein
LSRRNKLPIKIPLRTRRFAAVFLVGQFFKLCIGAGILPPLWINRAGEAEFNGITGPSPCNELDGSRATLMCLKARESVRLGMPVKISIDEYDYVIS